MTNGCFGWVVKHYSVLCNLNGPFIITLFTAIYCYGLGGSGFWDKEKGGLLHGVDEVSSLKEATFFIIRMVMERFQLLHATLP